MYVQKVVISKKLSKKIDGWYPVARLLATEALWVLIQTFLKNGTKQETKAKHSIARQKNKHKKHTKKSYFLSASCQPLEKRQNPDP
jgi:hypothetical protein